MKPIYPFIHPSFSPTIHLSLCLIIHTFILIHLSNLCPFIHRPSTKPSIYPPPIHPPYIHPFIHHISIHTTSTHSTIHLLSFLLPSTSFYPSINCSSIFLISCHLSIHPSSIHHPIIHASSIHLPTFLSYNLFSCQPPFHSSIYQILTMYLPMYPDYVMCSRQRRDKESDQNEGKDRAKEAPDPNLSLGELD